MKSLNYLTKYEVFEELNASDENIGTCVGISDLLNKTWKLSIYTGILSIINFIFLVKIFFKIRL